MVLSRIQFILFSLSIGTALFLQTGLKGVSVEDKWYMTTLLLMILLIVTTIKMFFSFDRIRNDRHIISYFIIIFFFCNLLVIHGLWQVIGSFLTNKSLWIVGSFDNPAGFAASFCAGFPVCLYFFNQQKKNLKRLAFISVLFTIIIILSSQSRAGILSIIVVIMFFCLLKMREKLKKKHLILLFTCLALSVTFLYLCKKDSANGRLLIWKCSWEMIKEKPLLGYGIGGFRANYMKYQASHFLEHPESSYNMLADNINRSFNEYISLLVNFGVIGFILFIVVVFFLWKSYRRNPCPETDTAFLCLLGIAVFSCFSYPLSYPFVWIIIILSVYILVSHSNYPVKINSWLRKGIFVFIICLSMVSIVHFFQKMNNQIIWSQTAKSSLIRQTSTTFAQYAKLLPEFKNNHLFLYNYAAELNYGEYYGRSQQIAEECCKLWADYDLQILMGYNCIKMEQYEKAENHFKLASYMCPVRFIPLYELMELYNLINEKEKSIEMAKRIVNKPVKIESERIIQMKKKSEEYLRASNI